LETEPTRICALLVGEPDVVVVGVGAWSGVRIEIATEIEASQCGMAARR
jgi:hypothetical protein